MANALIVRMDFIKLDKLANLNVVMELKPMMKNVMMVIIILGMDVVINV